MSIARSSDTAAGGDAAAGLVGGRVAMCANLQPPPNRHHPVVWKLVHTAAGAGRSGARVGALWALRRDRRDAV
eukprot:560237-Heterocapsa_arctica.AAC.1